MTDKSDRMNHLTATKRLWNHANLPEKMSQLPKEESFCHSLWQAEQTNQLFKLDTFYKDILSCFDTINVALNTNAPSDTIENKAQSIDRKISYAVSSILSRGWFDYYRWSTQKKFPNSFLNDLAAILIKIGIAWNFVLDGDIDEIESDTEKEFQIRNLTQLL